METPHRLVSSLEERFRSLEIEFHRAYWESQVDATPETERRRAETELALRRAKGDADSYRAVIAALETDIHEPILLRQLEVLRLSLTGNQMDEATRAELVELSSSVETDFAAFRPEVDGRRLNDNEIEEILKTSDDKDLRRRTWEASKEIGAVVADRIRELARLRNATAHDLGFADYYRMSLELQELSEPWLFDLLADVEELTEEPFARWKADLDARLSERFGTTELYPWHYADPFFQSLPPDAKVPLDDVLADRSAEELARKTFAAWGMDVSKVLDNSDLYPREKKSQHAFCIQIDRAGDIRILANVVPGERWIEVMLHESGHAAYDMSIDDTLPFLLRRPAHLLTTEAMALTSGRLVRDPRWLVEVAAVPDGEVEALRDRLVATTAAQGLLFARWCLVMTHFERDLYSDPESDLDARWWELVNRFQLITPPPDRKAPDWASKIHTAVAPVYYQNYLLGDIMSAQLYETCNRECGAVFGVPEAGRLLIERVFRPGASKRWDALVEDATGEPLSARYFAGAIAV